MTSLKELAVLSLFCAVAAPAGAATPVPHSFTAGTPAKAAEVNANFQAVVDQIAALVPPGTLLPYAGTTAPPGFLLCDGSAVSRTGYAALFGVVGITFGTGDGVSTFNLPDLRSRLPLGAGQGAGLTNRALGATGGEESHALTTGELASHNHGVTDPGHAHPLNDGASLVRNEAGGGYSGGGYGGNYRAATVAAGTTGITVDASGSGTPHNTIPPFLAVNWIIKI